MSYSCYCKRCGRTIHYSLHELQMIPALFKLVQHWVTVHPRAYRRLDPRSRWI